MRYLRWRVFDIGRISRVGNVSSDVVRYGRAGLYRDKLRARPIDTPSAYTHTPRHPTQGPIRPSIKIHQRMAFLYDGYGDTVIIAPNPQWGVVCGCFFGVAGLTQFIGTGRIANYRNLPDGVTPIFNPAPQCSR